MARAADHLPQPPLIFVDDGLTDAERQTALEDWLRELDNLQPVNVTARAADALAEARAEGEV